MRMFFVDNMHFYSSHVDGTTLGNATAGARVEIADLREPVLTVDADATGTLETIRQLSIQSPIAKVFGGQLDRIQVDGEASFDLQLRYPLGDKLNYAFTVGVRTNNGRLSIDGFTPPPYRTQRSGHGDPRHHSIGIADSALSWRAGPY